MTYIASTTNPTTGATHFGGALMDSLGNGSLGALMLSVSGDPVGIVWSDHTHEPELAPRDVALSAIVQGF